VSTIPYQFGQLERPPVVLIVSSKLRLPRGVPYLRVRKPLRDNVGELPLH